MRRVRRILFPILGFIALSMATWVSAEAEKTVPCNMKVCEAGLWCVEQVGQRTDCMDFNPVGPCEWYWCDSAQP